MPGHLGVGGVGHQQVDALGAEPGEAAQVGQPPVQRQLVHLEVAGVQDHARPWCGSPTASASGIEWLTAKNSRSNGPERQPARPRRPRRISGVIRCSVSLLATRASVSLEPTSGMSRALAQQVRDRADVVLVGVREDDRLDLVQPVLDAGEVRQDQVDAGLVGLGEQDAAVHDRAAGRRARRPSCSGRSRRGRPARRCAGRQRAAAAAGRAPGAGGSPELHAAGHSGPVRSCSISAGRRVGQRQPDRAAGQPEQAQRGLGR